MDVLLNSMGRIFTQYICISNHHIIQFKYLTIFSINLNKLGRGVEIGSQRRWANLKCQQGSCHFWMFQNMQGEHFSLLKLMCIFLKLMFFLFEPEKGRWNWRNLHYTSKEFFSNSGCKEKEQLHMVSCHIKKKKKKEFMNGNTEPWDSYQYNSRKLVVLLNLKWPRFSITDFDFFFNLWKWKNCTGSGGLIRMPCFARQSLH